MTYEALYRRMVYNFLNKRLLDHAYYSWYGSDRWFRFMTKRNIYSFGVSGYDRRKLLKPFDEWKEMYHENEWFAELPSEADLP